MLISCKAFPGRKIAHLWILRKGRFARWLKPDMCIFVGFYVKTSWCAKPIPAPCGKFGPVSHGCSWLVIQLFLFLTPRPDDKFRIVWNHPPLLDASRKHKLFLSSGAPSPQSWDFFAVRTIGKTSRKCFNILKPISGRVVDQLIYLAGVN